MILPDRLKGLVFALLLNLLDPTLLFQWELLPGPGQAGDRSVMPSGPVWQGQLTCNLGVVCHSDPTDIVVGCSRNLPCTSGPVAVGKNRGKLDTASKDLGGGPAKSVNWKQFAVDGPVSRRRHMAHPIFHLCISFLPPTHLPDLDLLLQ